MNFKSTIVLLVLLLGVGAAVFFTREKAKPDDAKPVAKTLLDLKSEDVTKLTVTNADGKTWSVAKSTGADGQPAWRLTKPVDAPAESYKITSILSDLTELKSTAEVGADATHTGLDHPQFTVVMTAGQKDTRLLIGDKLLSDGVYVRTGDNGPVNVVAARVVESLDKPANDLRKSQLFEASSYDVKQLTVTHADGSVLAINKPDMNWSVVKPTTMPADATAADALASAAVNLTPVEFLDDPKQAIGLDHPVETVTFSTAPLTTMPSTAPAVTTYKIGGYDDLQKKNVFIGLSDGSVVKVAATVLESLNKKPVELRDKTVVDIDPAKVRRVTIATSQPATIQPTTMPATASTTVVEKQVMTIGPPLPTTPATTGPTSAPVVVESQWFFQPDHTPADDAKVATLLGGFHPLKADKYLVSPGASKPAKQIMVTIVTTDGTRTVVVVKDGGDGPAIGSCNGLTFELPSTVMPDFSADLKKTPAVPVPMK